MSDQTFVQIKYIYFFFTVKQFPFKYRNLNNLQKKKNFKLKSNFTFAQVGQNLLLIEQLCISLITPEMYHLFVVCFNLIPI